jgi:two-component system sensor histidine kinase TctE
MTSVGVMEGGLVLLAALLIWPAARWSLRPLDGVRRELVDRASHELDFAPVHTHGVPSELGPVVGAFNTLLAQLDRSVAGVRQFTADASHQMRTPLAILKTHLTLLRRGRLAASQRASVEDALEAVDRLQRLIEQLLSLARADAVEELARAVSSVAEVAQARREAWTHAARANGNRLEIRLPPAPLYVRLAPALLEQLLENLVDNAIRYGGGVVEVAADGQADGVVIRVSDDGPGLPPAIAERAFERFVRLSQDPSGSGLGLAIVKALAERAGGSVRLRPRTQATRFSVEVTLPRAQAANFQAA